MIKEHIWELLGYAIALIGLNITIFGLLCSDLSDDVKRLNDRVDFLTRIVMYEEREG